MNCSAPKESGKCRWSRGKLPSMQILTVPPCAPFPSFMFPHLSRQHFMELDLGNVENKKVMCTNFFSLSESVAIYCKVYNKNIFITLLCFKVGHTIRPRLTYIVQAGFELMILTLSPMGAAILAPSPTVFNKETIRAQFYDITI